MEPLVLGRFSDRPRLVEIGDTILGFHVTSGPEQAVAARQSNDGGRSWTGPADVLPLPADPGRWAGPEALADERGAVHLFLVNDRGTGVFYPRGDPSRPRPLPMSEQRIDVWHTSSADSSSAWAPPRRIWSGYTGSINCAMQMKSGRIILPFAAYMDRSWTDRAGGVDDFWYTGSSAVTVLFSDDHGESWRQTPSELLVQTPTLRTYGAIEPVVMQLRDGRLWMLIRTQLGRFYQSYSEDGAEWSRPTPSDIISSDSPAGIVRAADGRLVLLWNKCLRFPYAYGGRHVLHGAVSEDEGRTWIGHREVFRDPLRQEPPPAGGDFGTAYPYLPTSSTSLTPTSLTVNPRSLAAHS